MKTITANQIRSLQIAAKQVGLRSGKDDGRYKLLLMQYKNGLKQSLTSCKQLTQWQYEDFMAICESMGYVHYSGDKNYYRNKRRNCGELISFAQAAAIRQMAKDLNWPDEALETFCTKMGKQPLSYLSFMAAANVIEALKAMIGRRDGTHYARVSEVADEYGGAKQSAGI